MKKIFSFSVLVIFITLQSQAQYSMDFGLAIGGSNYTGEIGSNAEEAQPWLLDMKFGQTRLSAGGFYRYNFTKNIAAKINFNYARIAGTDSNSVIKTAIARNLSFRTEIFEVALQGEYSFYTLNDLSRSSSSRIDFRAFVFAGIGAAFYYPYAQYQDKWYALRPLQTEGTENAYDEMTIILPLGAGTNFTFNKKYRLGLEIGYRFTFTDYLDDVSTNYAFPSELPFEESKIFANRSDQAYARGESGLPDRGHFTQGGLRGNDDTDDGYILAQFTFSYVIQSKSSFYKSRYNSIINRRRKRTKF